jgi:hypothetical protein
VGSSIASTLTGVATTMDERRTGRRLALGSDTSASDDRPSRALPHGSRANPATSLKVGAPLGGRITQAGGYLAIFIENTRSRWTLMSRRFLEQAMFMNWSTVHSQETTRSQRLANRKKNVRTSS